MTDIYIKNMVCNRCVMVVRDEFEKAGMKPVDVTLGLVHLDRDPSTEKMNKITARLEALGFEILDDRNKKLIEQIKNALIKMVQGGELEEHFSIVEFLSRKIPRDDTQLSRLFSEVEGITIEQFFILQKIEKVKELLVYDELTLSEIAWKLGYSSVAHLSAQFRKVTGLTPTNFKKMGIGHRRSIDQV